LRTSAQKRLKRHRRVRKKVFGTLERPRLCVFKSSNHICAQIIDDTRGHTIVAASTLEKSLGDTGGHTGNVVAARAVGELIGKKAVGKEIKKVVFDRGGYPYRGRVKTLADAAREAGLEF
jgi:large subunit ribosomal protein L18